MNCSDFQTDPKEVFENWRSQFVTSNRDKMGLRYRAMAFTEQGVAMLSSILNSERAIEVNIPIMRVFVRLCASITHHSNPLFLLERGQHPFSI